MACRHRLRRRMTKMMTVSLSLKEQVSLKAHPVHGVGFVVGVVRNLYITQ